MKSRTCPNCGYKYSFGLHLRKHFFQNVFSNWNCKNCGALLTVDAKRRIILAIVGIAPAALIPYLASYFRGYYLAIEHAWMLAIFLVLTWAVFVFSFDRFKLVEPAKTTPGEEPQKS
ncbi:hypothetical protein [Salinimicrobium flavum]|uniref:C2H2-type domain-containing protein n=1 Tax=Salinimicrobium flavum TaxID=1737065 RepID=A0ABW5J0U9_9FLAO